MNRVVQQCVATGKDSVVMVGKTGCVSCMQVERKSLKEGLQVEKYSIDSLEPEELQELVDCFGQSLPIIPETVDGVQRVRSLWNRGLDNIMTGVDMMPMEEKNG